MKNVFRSLLSIQDGLDRTKKSFYATLPLNPWNEGTMWQGSLFWWSAMSKLHLFAYLFIKKLSLCDMFIILADKLAYNASRKEKLMKNMHGIGPWIFFVSSKLHKYLNIERNELFPRSLWRAIYKLWSVVYHSLSLTESLLLSKWCWVSGNWQWSNCSNKVKNRAFSTAMNVAKAIGTLETV